ncbi:MAG: orotidine 5'-phosphate decarboxylase / HUMPS family protein [Anaerolineae bacterium]
MNRPRLQLALDNLDLQSALKAVQLAHTHIDIIEVGTTLCLSEGMNAVRTLRTLFPDHTLLADVRIIKAGGVIAKMCFEAGANWVSVMSDATQETLEAVVQTAAAYNGDVQIELNDGWTFEQAHLWRKLGIGQVILHRSSEVVAEEENWTEAAFETVRKLHNLGFLVTVTGGISVAEISSFVDVPVGIFIAGRAIRSANDPAAAAESFQKEISGTFAPSA